MRRLMLGGLAVMLVALTGCGSGARQPKWFRKPPDDPAYYVAAASAESMREQLAIDKARTSAQADIAQQIEARVGNLTKQFQEEVGLSDNSELLESFTSVTRVVSRSTLHGAKVREVVTVPRKNGAHLAYVLLVLPKAELAQQMLDEARKQEVLYTRFRASQAHEELQRELQEFGKTQRP
jgi:hypothetical protein